MLGRGIIHSSWKEVERKSEGRGRIVFAQYKALRYTIYKESGVRPADETLEVSGDCRRPLSLCSKR